MRALLAVEVLKLRSVRSTWGLVALAPVIVIVGVSGYALSNHDLSRRSAVVDAFAHVGLASLCSLVLGILAVAGEHRQRTITDTYLSSPHRAEPLSAKLIVHTALGAAVGVLASVTAVVMGEIWWAAKDVPLHLNSDAWTTLAGGTAWNALFAAIGVGVGALVRNLAGAIAVALAWIALVESIVAELIGSGLGRWLPFAAGRALGRVDVGGGHLPQWGAAVLLVGYGAVIVAAAVSTTVRSDVS